LFYAVFFFSSRRRHTRFSRDWSSDVCSSDLEALLLRMRAHPLPEARTYADLMLTELRKVIPSFLTRVDVADRGVATSAYMATNRAAMEEIAARLFPSQEAEPGTEPHVELVDFDPDAELHHVPAMLYPHTHHSDA